MPLFTSEYVFSDDYPTIEPSLKLDFANARALDPRISFTRASTATYVGANGLIKTAGVDEARFDHDPATGESLGLLVEEARSNLLLRSEEFDNAYWFKTRSSVTTNVIEAPDGTLTADKLVEDTTTNNNHIIYRGPLTGFGSNIYTFSVYVKAAERNEIVLRIDTDVTQRNARFNLVNGAVVNAGDVTARVENVGNGWYRCINTMNVSEQVINAVLMVADSEFPSSVYTGDGTSGLYIWGAQLEQGSFPTSYIPTSGSTATRAADYAKITGTNFTDFYNQSEGTIFSQHSLMDGVDNNNNCYVYQVDNGTNNEVAFRLIDKNTFYSNPSKLTATTLNSASSVIILQKSSVSSDTTLHSTSYAVKTDDFAVTFDGATVQTDNSGSLPNNQTTLSIGYNAPANTAQLNGHIKRISYYPKRLANAQLQTLTE